MSLRAESLADDLRTLASLPGSVCDDLWALLEPHVGAEVSESASAAATEFGARHKEIGRAHV